LDEFSSIEPLNLFITDIIILVNIINI
jgi:hypothetical protein